MLSAENLASIESEGRRLGIMARRDPGRRVPFYSDWTMTDLAVHTGSMHARTTIVVTELPTERVDPITSPDCADELDWYDRGLETMLAVLASADPDAPCWAFGSAGRVGFWERRMVIETGLHRWDAYSAFGEEDRLTDLVATSGLDEFPELWLRRLDEVPSIEMVAGDLGRSWTYGYGPSLTVEGTASDLYLRLMSRPSPVALPAPWTDAVSALALPPRPRADAAP